MEQTGRLTSDCHLCFLLGCRVANDPKMPEWVANAEFKAIREASLKQAP
jgi:hypothetical protein